ncbi:MAG: Flp pilus assembly complex ATPase component TadA [Oscillospiraceae bacterium]|nr:Flp pilus assembly complex ATPase component TadA [Oscillospiraceae bacterium]
MKNMPIGQYLVEKGLLTEENLQKVLEKQKESKGKMFGDVIVDMGLISDKDFAKVLAERLNVQYVDLDETEFIPEVVKKIPEAVAKKYNLIAISLFGKRLTVATNDPANFYIFEDVRIITGCNVVPVLATKMSIAKYIGKLYSAGSAENIAAEASQAAEDIGNDIDVTDLDLSADRIENAPIVKLANTIIENSHRHEATDIHIEPFEHYTRIRVRVNGDLVELMPPVSPLIHGPLVTRYKILSGMNIAEKRIPQDGRMSADVDGTHLDLRVSNLPTVHGEKVVIRILATGNVATRKVTDLGMNDTNYQKFISMLKVPQGVMLVTGPTGSGKTTTLYAALGEMAKPHVNVITVEDPVEKEIEGINQCQINDKAGMTFAAALRSILRQDPDIIMVGEMRDQETSEIAIRAAITGHMVLSTLHTNDAASTVTRLVDMGVAPYMVATSLIGIVAQRLTKVLCPDCKKLRMSAEEDNMLLGIDKDKRIPIYDAVGCPNCNNTGYRGRTAIHEILLCTSRMSSLITSGAKADAIAELAKEEGTRLLRDNVADLVQEGRTTMEELIRVTYAV